MAALEGALSQLGPIDRRLVSRFVADESYLELAADAGLTLDAVKVRFRRVRPFLRAWVGSRTESRPRGPRGWRRAA